MRMNTHRDARRIQSGLDGIRPLLGLWNEDLVLSVDAVGVGDVVLIGDLIEEPRCIAKR